MLAVQKQHCKNLMWAVAELQLQVVAHGLRGVKQGSFLQLLPQGAARQFQHRHNFSAFGRAQAFDTFQSVGPGVQQAGYSPKRIQEFLAHLQGVFARQAGAQQQRQQFGVTECPRTTGQQFFTRAGIFGQVFEEQWGLPAGSRPAVLNFLQ